MATPTAPKSILKKSPYPATPSSKEHRDREVALYHATILQQRKVIELEILMATETIIDYPLRGKRSFHGILDLSLCFPLSSCHDRSNYSPHVICRPPSFRSIRIISLEHWKPGPKDRRDTGQTCIPTGHM